LYLDPVTFQLANSMPFRLCANVSNHQTQTATHVLASSKISCIDEWPTREHVFPPTLRASLKQSTGRQTCGMFEIILMVYTYYNTKQYLHKLYYFICVLYRPRIRFHNFKCFYHGMTRQTSLAGSNDVFMDFKVNVLRTSKIKLFGYWRT